MDLAVIALDGLQAGALYTLVAVALVLIFKASNIVNFALGEFVAVSAYVSYHLAITMGLGIVVGLVGALLAGGILSMAMEAFIVRPVRQRSSNLHAVIATIGVSIVLIDVTRLVWGVHPKRAPNLLPKGRISVGSLDIAQERIGVVVFAAAAVLILMGFMARTNVGLQIRAWADSELGATVSGINIPRLNALSWGVAGVLAGFVGVLVAPLVVLEPTMGIILLKGFAAAVIGGISSLGGAIVGALLVGLLESYAGHFVGSVARDSVVYIMMLLILLVRPTGLFGRQVVSRY